MHTILIVGSGGREHALARKYAQSPQVSQVYVAPGSPAMQREPKIDTVALGVSDQPELIRFAQEKGITLTVIGPEQPLAEGIVDAFTKADLAVWGPTQAAAEIESSKAFSKNLMRQYNIPTAAYEVFTDAAEARAFLATAPWRPVIKADGLAAGKGVIIPETQEEALAALDEMAQFGASGETVVIEEFMEGWEFSFMAFVCGERVYPMVTAQDHKRVFDGDKGPNTGGMGAYAPVPQVTADQYAQAVAIMEQTAAAMVREGRPFCGFLFGGLMVTTTGVVKVIEFNARFGDPEAEVILPLLKNDLFQVCMDILQDKPVTLEWENAAVVGVVLASDGYPGTYATGVSIDTLVKQLDAVHATDATEGLLTYHCGTDCKDGEWVTKGGRVLLVACKGATVAEAKKAVYKALAPIKTPPLHYRRDIGKAVL